MVNKSVTKNHMNIGYTFTKSEIEIMAGVYGKGGIDDKTFDEIADRLEGGFVEIIWDAVKEEVLQFFSDKKWDEKMAAATEDVMNEEGE